MANEEQLAILRWGPAAWNVWRENHLLDEQDLLEADLQGANLEGVNLRRANLQGANLQEANLRNSDLQEANLSGINLQRADLQRANLQQADFLRAELQEANLQGANLQGANLQEATLINVDLTDAVLTGVYLSTVILQRANLSRADLGRAIFDGTVLTGANLTDTYAASTVFANLDLRQVHGLDSVQHIAPSTIGIDTLYRSQGQIPESFLRGCGVPDSMIEYARALVAAERPIDYYSCFISYSSHDEALAKRLHADLQAAGVRCWYAPEDLKIGESILGGIDQGIRLHDKLLLLLSESSVTSAWVDAEVQMALVRERAERRRVLFPVRIDDAVITSGAAWAALVRGDYHIGDFRQWKDHDRYQQAFQRLLRDLKAEP